MLVQGAASYDAHPDRAVLESVVGPASTRFMGPPRRGPFWDRWLRAYYADRVLVTVQRGARTVLARPGLRGPARGGGQRPRRPATRPQQTPPKGGPGRAWTWPARRGGCAACPTRCVGYRGADGFPLVVPVTIGADSEPRASRSRDRLPAGGRRAGLLAHATRRS